MNSLSVLCIILGTVIIVTRGPLIFSPSATLRAADRLILSTNTRLRTWFACVAILGVALLTLPSGEGLLPKFLEALGWLTAIAGFGCSLFPDALRRFARIVFTFIENSVDDVIMRLLGVLSALAGLALVYAGIYVV